MVEIIDAALAAGRSPLLPHQTGKDITDGSLDQADALLSSDLSNMALALSSILASQTLSPQVLALRSLDLHNSFLFKYQQSMLHCTTEDHPTTLLSLLA